MYGRYAARVRYHHAFIVVSMFRYNISNKQIHIYRYLAVRNVLMKELGRRLTTVEKVQVKAQLVQIAAMEIKAAYERKKRLLDEAHQIARRSRRVSYSVRTHAARVRAYVRPCACARDLGPCRVAAQLPTTHPPRSFLLHTPAKPPRTTDDEHGLTMRARTCCVYPFVC